MDSDSNSGCKHTEQLIDEMMSFLDEPTECYKNEDSDESKNPLCAGIKNILETFPASTAAQGNFHLSADNRRKGDDLDRACRYKDPYVQEVNKLMFCSTMGHPPNGSPEYFQAAENYALYGKDFLDFPNFPTDVTTIPKPMDLSCFNGDLSARFPYSYPKLNSWQGCGGPNHGGKYPNTGNITAPQLPSIMMNPANYWGYPLYQHQTANLIQPLWFSNPFLMTQYLNMFVRETQINTSTSFVQQQQIVSGGIPERLVYAQMLQQIQTNQGVAATQGGFLNFSERSGTKQKVRKMSDGSKNDQTNPNNFWGEVSDVIKTNFNRINLCENNVDLEE